MSRRGSLTSNNVSKVMLPLQSRFLVINLEPYTYEQYLSNYSCNTYQSSKSREIANPTANAIGRRHKRQIVKNR